MKTLFLLLSLIFLTSCCGWKSILDTESKYYQAHPDREGSVFQQIREDRIGAGDE